MRVLSSPTHPAHDQPRTWSVAATFTLLALASAGVAVGQARTGWIPFTDQAPTRSQLYIKEETTSGMLVNFDIPGMYVHEVEVAGVTYHRLSVPGRSVMVDVGRPELPIVGQLLEIPFGVGISVELVKSDHILLDGYNVYPAQEPAIRQAGREPEFVLDRARYQTDAFFPARAVDSALVKTGVIRGHRVAFIKVSPVQYNPVTQQLRAYSNLEVRVTYDRPAQIERVDPRIQADAFEEMLAVSLLNYKPVERLVRLLDDRDQEGGLVVTADVARHRDSSTAARDDRSDTPGCDYLIITPAGFYTANDPQNPIVRLRNWKRQKGLDTEVVTLAQIPDGDSDGDTDAVDIGAYIQTAYDTWVPPPTYILLVGDTGDNNGNVILPTNYVTPHPYWGYENPASAGQQAEIGTDLYYVDVDGNDVFPDIYIGRLSVDTVAQATDVVDKILAYERKPPAEAGFYTDATLVALFEDRRPADGQEDTSFHIVEFTESIQDFLNGNGYTMERVYDQSGDFSKGPLQYEDGTNLPTALTVAGGFPWNGGTADITNAINNGSFLVTYDGHGDRESWARPGFDRTNITALTNAGLTPVVFSLACETGWFDNETDRGWLKTSNSDEGFAESFIRAQNAGAVGVLAATRVSWAPNDFMMLGMYEAIWPQFAPNPPFSPGQLPAAQSGPLRRLGQIDVFSKVYMANYYASTSGIGNYAKYSFELYHVLGDPEMPIWTAQPAALTVYHPAKIGSTGTQDFVVRVTDAVGGPVAGAVVALTYQNDLAAVGRSDADGVTRFTDSFSSGPLGVTATAANFQPYEGTIQVTASGARIDRLDPGHGPEGQSFNVGGRDFSGSEDVRIYLDGTLKTTRQASGGSFGQAGLQDVAITVPAGHRHGLVNVEAVGETSGRAAVDVFQVRDANPVELYTYSQWDSLTWHLHGGDNPTWNNPEIELYDTNNNLVQSNNLIVGRQYRIRARIHNDSSFQANGATVIFRTADFGAGQLTWTDIGTDQVTVAGSGSALAEVDWVPPITGHLCVTAEVSHVEDITPNDNKGQENCDVRPTSSPAMVPFTVWNPADAPAAVYYELRQLGRYRKPVWKSRITHPDPQVLQPGDEAQAEIVVDPDGTDAEPGTSTEFALTAFVDGEMIGGVNVIAERRLPLRLVSFHAGYADPSGTFSSFFDSGWSLFLDYARRITPRISVVGLLGYNEFDGKPREVAAPGSTYWINLNATAQYTHPLRRGYAFYIRGGPGYYLPESGSGKLGAVSGLGITYASNDRWTLALGADFHVIREGMAVYNLGPASNRDDLRFAVLSLGVVRGW